VSPQNRSARTLKGANIPFFATLSDFTFNLIAEVSRVVTYNAGETIFRAGDVGDNFYIICDGSVRLLSAADGKEFKVRGWRPQAGPD
jgi:CRP-like cAMP-binding protein